MKRYRIIKDNFLGFEAQVKYAWFPFIWFQLNDFYWINTWPSAEEAKNFVTYKKANSYKPKTSDDNDTEYEKEIKLLGFQQKNFLPKVVWTDRQEKVQTETSRRWWPAFPLFNG